MLLCSWVLTALEGACSHSIITELGIVACFAGGGPCC